MVHHQKMVGGLERMARYVAEMYKIPTTLQEWVDTTQAMQAEVLRRAVEHWRRNRNHTSGALVWTNHDAYPAISWSLIDWYRRPKQAWHAARQFFNPVLVSAGISIGNQEVAAIPLTAWGYPHEACPIQIAGFPAQQDTASPGELPVTVTVKLINDSGAELSGEIKLRIFREGEEPVLLESQAIAVEANGESQELVRQFAVYQLQPLPSLRLEAVFVPDAPSGERLKLVEDMINSACNKVAGADTNLPAFSIKEGLICSSGFVEPKYIATT